MGEVEVIPTPLSMAEVRPILKDAYLNQVGSLDNWRQAEPYLMAMVALENDHGRKIRNHNWGERNNSRR